ncbi:MAG: PIG-L family deacetylase [Actinomycetota bacterium]
MTLTLMAVHAHPDDECISTGGLLAKYASEGIRVVLVTCTNGEMGDGPEGIKPDHPDHDPEAVAKTRLEELRRSAEILGVAHLETLGYRDSGMMGWKQNEDPDCFWNTPLDVASKRIEALMQTYEPEVIVTYDENGFYGHPDHIQAHRAAMQATRSSGIPAKLYYTAVAKQDISRMFKLFAELDTKRAQEMDFDPENPPFGCDESLITTRIDVSKFVSKKRESMEAHASQESELDFLKLDSEMFAMAFKEESYIRAIDNTKAPLPEVDLFSGLR